MNTFNYHDTLKKMITTQQLVEVNLLRDLGQGIAYLIDANDDYLTFAKVTNDVTLDGITICSMSDVESIQTETAFIRELMKSISDNSLHTKVVQTISPVQQFSFSGFAKAFVNKKTIVTVDTEGQKYTGRIVAYDGRVVVIDEYYAEENERFTRSYINPAIITQITVGGTWLDIISRSLSDKKL